MAQRLRNDPWAPAFAGVAVERRGFQRQLSASLFFAALALDHHPAAQQREGGAQDGFGGDLKRQLESIVDELKRDGTLQGIADRYGLEAALE